MEQKDNQQLGIKYKQQGNDYWKKKQYDQAIECYTNAINVDDTQSTFFSNRAMCYFEQKQFEKAKYDSIMAIELNDKNIKAQLTLGKSLAELSKLDQDTDKIEQAIIKMTKALTLCSGQKHNYYEEQLRKYILRAKKLRWFKQNAQQKQNKNEMLKYIQELLATDQSLSLEERTQMYIEIISVVGAPNGEINFNIPEHLCCFFSKELMANPVANSVGNTYEKENLMKFIQENGNKDPRTQQEININMIYPNLNLKRAIEQFLEDNPWAFEFSSDDPYKEIQF